MKNKLLFAAFQCALFCGLSLGFVLPLVAQVKREVPLPRDQMAQLSKDSDHIRAIMPKASFEDIVRLKNSLETEWKLKNKKVYLELLVELGHKMLGYRSNFSEEKRAELLEIFSTSFLQEFDAMTAGQKVNVVHFFSGVNQGQAPIPYNEEVSQRLDIFIKTEMALEEQKATAEALPIPEKVDLSKYDWSSQPVAMYGMSPEAFKDPELRKVWQRVLDREYVIRRKSGMKSEAFRSGQILSAISPSFISRLDLSSAESKADVKKKLDAPEVKKLKGGIIAPLLEAKLKELP